MSYVTMIIGISSDYSHLEKILQRFNEKRNFKANVNEIVGDTWDAHWFLEEELIPKIYKIEHVGGDKGGHHYMFCASVNGFFHEGLKEWWNTWDVDYFEWICLHIIPESDFIFTYYKRNF